MIQTSGGGGPCPHWPRCPPGPGWSVSSLLASRPRPSRSFLISQLRLKLSRPGWARHQLSSCYKLLLVIISVLGGASLGKNLARYSGISYGLSSGTWIHYICQFLPSPGSGSGSVLRVQFSVSVTPGVIDDWELSFAHHPSHRRTVKGGLRKRLRLQLLWRRLMPWLVVFAVCWGNFKRLLGSSPLPLQSTIHYLLPGPELALRFPPLLRANPNIQQLKNVN